MPHGYFATTTPAENEAWNLRDSELERIRRQTIVTVRNDDTLWEPCIRDTLTEIFWDNSRVDAAELVGNLMLRGETIDPREIALLTVDDNLATLPGELYKGVDGEVYLRSMIIEWNERMVEAMLPAVEEIK